MTSNQIDEGFSQDSEPPNLLERAPTQDYIQEWTETLKKQQTPVEDLDTISVLVFRLGHEWFALSTACFKEATYRRQIHHVPHWSGSLLYGIINLNGELRLCVDLYRLLGIESAPSSLFESMPYRVDRMMAIKKDGDFWAFPVDEIAGIHVWKHSAIENVPANINKSTTNYLKGIMRNEDKHIGLLDEELLFYSLRRSIL